MAKKISKAKKKRVRKRPSQSSRLESIQIEVEPDKLPVLADPTLKLVWADQMSIAVRSGLPVVTLRFLSVLGADRRLEVAHIQISSDHAKRMVDLIARHLDYYPKKPS